jgi:drug/metabolite transporter (DMT)-like permease
MKNQSQAMLSGLGAVLMWSTVATAFKLSLRDLTPVQLLLIACVTTVLVLVMTLIFQRRFHLLFSMNRRQWLQSLGMGLVNPCLYYLMLFAAYDRLPAQEAQPLNYTWALVLAYMSVPFLGQRLLRTDILAGLVCYTGVVIISTGGDVLSLTFSDSKGVALALGSTLVWASYWILAARDNRDPVVALLMNFTCSLPVLALICGMTGGFDLKLGIGSVVAVYVGVFEMGLAFVLWTFAMKKAENTARISNLIFISPFLSLIFIHYILGETIVRPTYIGLALIVGGLWIQQRGATRGPATASTRHST